MIEVLPIKVLADSDTQIFGNLNVALGKLQRSGVSVGSGIVVTPPNLHLKTVLEHFDFGKKEIFEQSLTLVRKEINAIAVPEVLFKETGKHNKFFVSGNTFKSIKEVWVFLLNTWVDQIKVKLWNEGFSKGVTENLSSQTVFFIKKVDSFGSIHFDPLQDDSVINVKSGQLHPNDLKKLHDLVEICNKKLLIPHEYEWIIDNGVKIVGIKPYTSVIPADSGIQINKTLKESPLPEKLKSTVKVFLDFSSGLVVEKEADGVFIASEKTFDLNKPHESFENTLFKLVETAITFPELPVLFKLADISEGMGKVRGALRLLHQKNLFDPLIEILDFTRHKKNLTNVHIVIPFIRSFEEFIQIKRELAVKKLGRKHSLQLWLELAVPENIINLEAYLIGGLDGVILNLDELVAYLNGFDHTEDELTFYKNEVDGLIKFLEDGLKLMHRSKVPFIAQGVLTLNPKVLDFLIEKGVSGIIVERYEAPSAHDLLRQAEKRMILRKSE